LSSFRSPAGSDQASTAIAARPREDRDPAAGDLTTEHHAREPREVRAGVLDHPGQGQPELHRDAVDVAHLSDADPRDRPCGAALNHPSLFNYSPEKCLTIRAAYHCGHGVSGFATAYSLARGTSSHVRSLRTGVVSRICGGSDSLVS
jgi:hypothetical protein